MSDTQVEQLLREIRDLQAQTLQAIQDSARVTQNRADMLFGNVHRSRMMSLVFVILALLVIGVIFLRIRF